MNKVDMTFWHYGEWVNSGLTPHLHLGHKEAGPLFKDLSEWTEKRG